MFINTNGIDLIDIRNKYEEIINIFDDLMEGAEWGPRQWNIKKALTYYLERFVEETFTVDRECFIQEAFQEICDLKGVEEGGGFEIGLQGAYRFKIEKILGMDDKELVGFYRLDTIPEYQLH